MNVRGYTDADWESVINIYNLSKPDELRDSVDLRALVPFERDTRNLRLFRESRIVVVEEDETLLGFGGNNSNYISWLFVHPDHRRRGVATLILRHVMNQLNGTIKLNVFKHNTAARLLYQKAGFEIEREFVGNLNGYKTQAMTLRFESPERSEMAQSSILLRAAAPTLEEGEIFTRYLDMAAEGFFRLLLGRRSVEIIAKAYTLPKHDLSYQHVTFAERNNVIVGMFSGYTAADHRRSSDLPMREAAGGAPLRMMVISLLFAPLLSFIDAVPDGDFYLQAIAVEPELKGKGVGSTLLEAAEEFARERGAQRISLDVFVGNHIACDLYKRRGMRVVSQWPKRLRIPGFKIFRMAKAL